MTICIAASSKPQAENSWLARSHLLVSIIKSKSMIVEGLVNPEQARSSATAELLVP